MYIHTHVYETHTYTQGCDRHVIEHMPMQALRAIEGALRQKIAFAQCSARLVDSAHTNTHISKDFTNHRAAPQQMDAVRGGMPFTGRTLGIVSPLNNNYNNSYQNMVDTGQISQLKMENEALRLQLAELQALTVTLEVSPHKRTTAVSTKGTQIIFDHMKREVTAAKTESLRFEVCVFVWYVYCVIVCVGTRLRLRA
jgi:hypothetical protein